MLMIYAGKDIQSEKLAELLGRYGYPYTIIGDECLDVEIQNILKEKRERIPAKGNTLILMDGMNEDQIRAFNRLLNEHSFSIPRMAVTTENNIKWTLSELLDEIEQEFVYFTAREELYELLTHPDQERLKADPQYLKMMSQAYALLEDERADGNLIRAVIQMIKYSK